MSRRRDLQQETSVDECMQETCGCFIRSPEQSFIRGNLL